MVVGGRPDPGALSPAGRVLAELATAVGRPILDVGRLRTSRPCRWGGRGRRGTVLLLADLSGQDRQVLVRSAGSDQLVPIAGWAVTRVEQG